MRIGFGVDIASGAASFERSYPIPICPRLCIIFNEARVDLAGIQRKLNEKAGESEFAVTWIVKIISAGAVACSGEYDIALTEHVFASAGIIH